MKAFFLKSAAIAVFFLASSASAPAQGFLKKAAKVAKSAATTALTTSSSETATATPVDTALRSALLDESLSYTVKRVVETDDSGKQLTNDDGTPRVRYFIINSKGCVCDAEAVKSTLEQRAQAYKKILAKIGAGAATGALSGLSSGGGKGAAVGAATGALAGLGLSAGDIKTIRKINKSLKAYRETVEKYQQTFTDEGTPRDASVDVAKIFPDAEETTKSASQIDKEMAESKTSVDALKDLDPDKI